jgi:hypothetical protein
MTTKADLHQLIDALPDMALDEAGRRLAALEDPVLAAFMSAPDDDEPVTDEDLAAIAEAEESIAREGTIPWKAYKHQRQAQAG